jgi:tetratricopeptide (TPR) repeat protein
VAVLIQAWDVVARRGVLEEKLDGGASEWFQRVPNSTACADRNLCRASFMDERDAEVFLREIEAAGVEGERGGAYQDVALVNPSGPWRHACGWIEVGEYAGVTAAWLKATEPDPMVVPLGYRPDNGVVYVSAKEAAGRLEFLRRDGNVEVYLDKQTGAEVYRGRTTEEPEVPGDAEQRFQAVLTEIQPLLTFNGVPRRLGWLKRRRLRKGIAELEALTSAFGDVWRVWWFLGMARRSASDPQGAYAAFREAYHRNPEHAGVLREYSGQCLALGLGDESVALARRNCEANPDDGGLRSNLALALMIAGDMQAAASECATARKMEPEDPITRALEGMIDDVLAGRRPRPTKYP